MQVSGSYSSSDELYSDEELDDYGNLAGFIDDSHLPNPKKRKRNVYETISNVRDGKIFRELSTDVDIIGRESETRQLLSMIMIPEGGVRPLLLGPAGVGILSIVKKAAQMRKIYCLDCMELRADCVAENITELIGKKLRKIFNYALNQSDSPPVFYFRHIEKILHLDHISEYLQSFLKRRYPFIASISTEPKSETAVKAMEMLARYNFTPFEVKEPPIEDVQQIALKYLRRHPLHPAISITEEAVALGVRLAAKYEHSRPFPVKATNLIQECANRVLLEKQSSGMQVDKITIAAEDIAQAVSFKTKVPAIDLMEGSVFNQDRFIARLKSRVVGQDHAIDIVSDKVAVYKMGLADTKKPWGVFLFVGPTGVGKTELARALAKFLFSDESRLITINGSEYIEDHTVSNLIGSPKGYEGNESGGLLTEPLKKNPHQVVLLDEFEKAHPNVQKLFLQVFDGAPLIDRKGDEINCSQAIFIMTSNVGSQMLSEAAERGPISPEEMIQTLTPLLKQEFSPELVGRFKRGIVPFLPLDRKNMPEVARVKLAAIKDRLQKGANIDFVWTSELEGYFAGADVDLGLGMRDFCNMIDETVTNQIKDAIRQSSRRITGKLVLTYLKSKGQFMIRLPKKNRR
jgi:DNA polymerase III delta prime subunit